MTTPPQSVDLVEVPILSRLQAQAPPPVLYHYTRRGGLLGILSTKTLHASSARYLNDAQELSTAILLARTVLDGREAPTPDIGKVHSLFRSFLAGAEQMSDAFVFSMSHDGGDVLSQWRAYARPGDGYAIGFDGPTLADTLKARKEMFLLAPCQYDEVRQRDLLTQVFADAEKELKDAIARGVDAAGAQSRAFSFFAISFLLAAPIVKHRAFRDEQEWRLIFPLHPVFGSNVEFRDAGNLLVPFYKVVLERLPIAEVVIGPTPHALLEMKAVSALLSNKDVKVAVRLSAIPYRDW